MSFRSQRPRTVPPCSRLPAYVEATAAEGEPHGLDQRSISVSAPYSSREMISFIGVREMRFFNTAGPVDCDHHYCLPPLERLDTGELLRLIDQKKYFVLHAPRQTGKTSCLLALRDSLNQAGRHRCLYFNVESGQTSRGDVDSTIRTVLDEMGLWARTTLGDSHLDEIISTALSRRGSQSALSEALTLWAEREERPLVLLIDEIDALEGDGLISVLRQLRSGYPRRPGHFPQSVVLCGVRDVRDYRIRTSSQEIVTGGSAFNVRARSLRLGDFGRPQVEQLYQQHVQDTGQEIKDDAIERIWELTQGQPWLVNALGYECCFEMPMGRDRTHPVTVEMVEQAKENLIERRETHLDQLADKLHEKRVRHVIEVLLAGEGDPEQLPRDDIDYVRDLGLIASNPPLAIANPIYREVIPREIVSTTEETIAQEPHWYVRPDGSLDLVKLLTAFTDFFRQHSEHWLERFDYKEAGPQLLMQAFLHRVVNSGGRVEREYGLGRRRTDLLIIWRRPEAEQRAVIELKILRGSRDRTIEEGLQQTAEYMDRCGAGEGHLVIFDRNPQRTWAERIFRKQGYSSGRDIWTWGM